MKYFLIITIVVLFHSCSNTSKKVTVASLEGTYTVTTIDNMTSFPETPTFEINAQELKISGFSGCNRFFGAFTFSENNLKFGPLGTTQMMCPEEQNVTEKKLLKALEQTTNLNFENNTLSFRRGKVVLVEAIREIQ